MVYLLEVHVQRKSEAQRMYELETVYENKGVNQVEENWTGHVLHVFEISNFIESDNPISSSHSIGTTSYAMRHKHKGYRIIKHMFINSELAHIWT